MTGCSGLRNEPLKPWGLALSASWSRLVST